MLVRNVVVVTNEVAGAIVVATTVVGAAVVGTFEPGTVVVVAGEPSTAVVVGAPAAGPPADTVVGVACGLDVVVAAMSPLDSLSGSELIRLVE